MPTTRVPRPLLLTHGIWAPRSLVRFAVVGALMAALWSAIGLGAFADGPVPADQAALEAAVGLQHPTVVAAAHTASWIGDLPVVSAVAITVALIAYRRSGRWDLGWLTLAVIGGALAVTATVKAVTDRVRPDGSLTDTFSSAFPSGHAVRAAAVCSLVAWLALRWTSPDRRTVRAAVVTGATLMTLAIGASRLLLGAHWLSDVLAGYLLGLLWLAACVAVTAPHRAPRADTAPGSGLRVDHEGQDRPDPVAAPQPPRRDRQGPPGPAHRVDEQDGATG